MTVEPGRAVVVGIDFGTLSGRAVVVRVADGAELGTGVHEYSHAVVDRILPGTGQVLPPDWALQVPSDYVDVLRHAVPAALAAAAGAGVSAADVIGVGTDFTACTVLPVATDGTPLCELERFADRPHAYVKLWKHHAAQGQADRINELARVRGESWLPRYGGLISSEWEFAKALQVLEEDPEIYAATAQWVEAADWIVWQLTGRYTRNACTAGYKGIFQDGVYPSPEFLRALAPGFAGFVEDKLVPPDGRLGDRAGGLTEQAAAWTGLPAGIAVCVGNVDAHVTAPAGNAVAPGQMVAIMGTSTCHVMNGERLADVPGMCGVVDGGITAGLFGYEAGQSGVGDIFGHFVDTGVPAAYSERAVAEGRSVHEVLTELAAAQPVGAHGLVALDWQSGNRSVLVDHELSGVVLGQTLQTRPEDVYRALIEATAFGARTIIEAFEGAGVPVEELVIAGGLTKNALLMQIYADVTRRPLSVVDSAQAPALGSAIHAAVAAGAYPDVPAAAAVMGRIRRGVFLPVAANSAVYDRLFAEYTLLHDHFGRGGNAVMHRLKALRREVLGVTPGGSGVTGSGAPEADAVGSDAAAAGAPGPGTPGPAEAGAVPARPSAALQEALA
ncbi:ribulokinase [Nakamurella sp. YIM 132087]|uniref:Ribulokinase n=1 Tax=Nakamurella alba TaxID=2665158 RepID=A0A7K1FKS5_9ACTN|nr:ribulokinase [Nakamurella alba]MTD13999.1 ribulokinase [Nakamurella alba]